MNTTRRSTSLLAQSHHLTKLIINFCDKIREYRVIVHFSVILKKLLHARIIRAYQQNYFPGVDLRIFSQTLKSVAGRKAT